MLSNFKINELLDDVSEKGWFYKKEAFSKEFCLGLLADMKYKNMSQATVGNKKELRPDIRGDLIYWLEEEDKKNENTNRFLTFTDNLKADLNNNFYLGLNNFECHYSLYNKGAFYKAHRDNVLGKNNRLITFILYLNDNWKPEDGGQLKVFADDQTETILDPTIGSIVCFDSIKVLHEVMLSNNKRQAFTGWFNKL